MKASELMTGNWVEYKGYHVQWDCSDFCDNTAKRLSNPIPLSEEWLLKFGFRQVGDCYRMNIIPEGLELMWLYGELSLQTIGSGFTISLPTKYVHQLQNFYHALTGEELSLNHEINPTPNNKQSD